MTRENKSWWLKTAKLVDFDAVSLYPSAIARLYAFWGAPEYLPEDFVNKDVRWLLASTALEAEQPTEVHPLSGFTISCKIKRLGKELKFPLLCYKEDGKCKWTNSARPDQVVVINEIDARMLVKFHEADIEVIDGYVWKGGKDFSCQSAVKNLFDLRKQAKAIGSPLQEAVKLILNSAYGKSVLKMINKEKHYVPPTELEGFLKKHASSVLEYYKTAGRLYCVEVRTQYFDQVNDGEPELYPNWWGARILSMSKMIMAEVMCLAEDIGVEIYYTDTDSMIMDNENGNALVALGDAFEEHYHRKLIGNDLGQFHSDFALPGSVETPYGSEGIFIAKKIYAVKLVGKNKDGEPIEGFHLRMKGVPDWSYKWEDYKKLFSTHDLTAGIKFDLSSPTKGTFKFTKEKEVITLQGLSRTLSNRTRERHILHHEEVDLPSIFERHRHPDKINEEIPIVLICKTNKVIVNALTDKTVEHHLSIDKYKCSYDQEGTLTIWLVRSEDFPLELTYREFYDDRFKDFGSDSEERELNLCLSMTEEVEAKVREKLSEQEKDNSIEIHYI